MVLCLQVSGQALLGEKVTHCPLPNLIPNWPFPTKLSTRALLSTSLWPVLFLHTWNTCRMFSLPVLLKPRSSLGLLCKTLFQKLFFCLTPCISWRFRRPPGFPGFFHSILPRSLEFILLATASSLFPLHILFHCTSLLISQTFFIKPSR